MNGNRKDGQDGRSRQEVYGSGNPLPHLRQAHAHRQADEGSFHGRQRRHVPQLFGVRLRSQAVTALAVILLCATGAVRPALAGVAAATLGDDIILTDGRKITGTVVGMENGSFRVETDFGVALIRKDKVARIEVSKGAASSKPSDKVPDKPPERPPEKAAVRPVPPAKARDDSGTSSAQRAYGRACGRRHLFQR